MSFTWMPLYAEIARKVLEFENRQPELLALLRGFEERGLQLGSLDDKDADKRRIPLVEIDPFTFFAMFNWQGRKPEKRTAILGALREAWQLAAPLPDDYDGIPLANRQNLWLFDYQRRREPGDIARLWQFARQVVEGTRATVNRELFVRLLDQRTVGEVKLSIGMFWLNPREFLPADKWTRGYMEHRGVSVEVWNGEAYFEWLDACVAKGAADFPAVSLAAYSAHSAEPPPIPDPARNIWLFAPGTSGGLWDEMREEGVMAIGWPQLGNLSAYADRDAVARALNVHNPDVMNPVNDALACWQFVHTVQPGDIIIAKTGRKRVLGWGVVTGDYEHVDDLEDFRNRRAVDWRASGEWISPEHSKLPIKTLTEISRYASFVESFERLMGVKFSGVAPVAPRKRSDPYTHADALDGLFMDAPQLSTILARLARKKALILTGPPGVGKTFVARRLAFALMGERDEARVCTVQFHPSYGYEDFVQGYRPDGSGLQRRDGVFHQFARRARNDDPARPWVFIIDEINRGNLAKIFGELLMLIEADKRGREHAVPLTYAESLEETFWLPENLHIIGTMNTADRSLAMVDYALRRRFGFVAIEPALARAEFRAWLAARGATAGFITRLIARVTELNDAIEREPDLRAGFRIGHSYFCPAAAPADWEAWFREVVEAEIAPLIEEYFERRERVAQLTAALNA